jgi:hypothetical protein
MLACQMQLTSAQQASDCARAQPSCYVLLCCAVVLQAMQNKKAELRPGVYVKAHGNMRTSPQDKKVRAAALHQPAQKATCCSKMQQWWLAWQFVHELFCPRCSSAWHYNVLINK